MSRTEPIDCSNADFYDRTAWWLGTTNITERDRRRAALIDAVPGGPHNVLELGAGFGGTAAATADLGHHVVAVERSPDRAALARRHCWDQRNGRIEVIEADFNMVNIEGNFEVIAYWSGFGNGNDLAQRHLLERIREWINPGGRVFIDIFDPAWWAEAHGTQRVINGLCQRLGFDPITRRLSVAYWPLGRPGASIIETIRCYSLEEVTELVRGTGLANVRLNLPPGLGGVSYLIELTTQ